MGVCALPPPSPVRITGLTLGPPLSRLVNSERKFRRDEVALMSSGLNLYCFGDEGGSWVDVRSLVYVLGAGGYNRLLRLLGRSCYEIHRSRSSTWVVSKKSCDEMVREINELVEEIMTKEEGGEAGSSECRPADIGSIANAVVGRVSGLIPSLKDVVDEVAINLEAGNHVMFIGPRRLRVCLVRALGLARRRLGPCMCL